MRRIWASSWRLPFGHVRKYTPSREAALSLNYSYLRPFSGLPILVVANNALSCAAKKQSTQNVFSFLAFS